MGWSREIPIFPGGAAYDTQAPVSGFTYKASHQNSPSDGAVYRPVFSFYRYFFNQARARAREARRS